MLGKIELKPNQTLLFIGDSITDADRNRQCYKPFGFGYVHFVANMLLAKYPAYNLNIVNRGINGNTITDLKNRWQRDCLNHKPDILSVLIGVNDVWRRVEEGGLSDAADLGEYDSTYRLLLAQAKEKCNSQLVICEPFMFCDDLSNPVFVELRRYVEIVRKIATDLVRRPCGGFDVVLVPLQKLIYEQLSTVASEKWSDDMVHPHIWAHTWIAQQWFKSTGLWQFTAEHAETAEKNVEYSLRALRFNPELVEELRGEMKKNFAPQLSQQQRDIEIVQKFD